MTDTSKATIAAVVERLQDHLTLKWMSPPSKITGEECQMVTVEALEQTLSLISALEAERDALRAQVEFTMSDHQRLLRKEDVEGTCTSIAVCFDGGRGVRCGPCAIKQAAAAKVETDLTIPNSPEVSRLNRTLATLQAKLEKAAEALEPFSKDHFETWQIDVAPVFYILAAEQRVMEECAQIAREHDMASGESIAHMIMTRHEWQAAAIRKGGEHA